MKRVILVILGLLLAWSSLAIAAKKSWPVFVAELKQDAVSDGIEPRFFDNVFRGIRPNKRVISYDRRQPEKRLTFLKYRKTRADAYRIKLGKREYKKHKELIDSIGNHFKVDPCLIVAFWGLESSYGRYKGNFNVIKSLATLAYDDRRSDFFRKELILALHILQDGHVHPSEFKGEWAGGSGHPQFLPSSWHRYAVDYNQDGRRDIWDSLGDVFASIANYVSSNGWQPNQPWAAKVSLPKDFDDKLVGYKSNKTIAQWKKLGVKIHHKNGLPPESEQAWIVKPHGGPTIMAFKNFRVIMRYNSSTFYAGTVGYMTDAICARPQSL